MSTRQRIISLVIVIFFTVFFISHLSNTFASTFRYVETIQMDNYVADIATYGSMFLILYGAFPTVKILISDLSGNIIQSFDALGSLQCRSYL